jgi:nicotinamide phosphoribosyltransferase
MRKNIVTNTDSYKFMNNAFMMGVSNVWSAFMSRKGAKYPTTVMTGLQYFLIEYFEGVVVTSDKLQHARFVAQNHLGSEHDLNEEMWETIINEYGGKLPLTIKAMPEGTEVPQGVPLMAVTLTKDDDRLKALPNHVETILTNVYGACTVATKSKYIKRMLLKYAEMTAEDNAYVNYQVHDFAQRSVKAPEQAGTSGFGHLLHFFGTDTVLAWELALDYYGGIPATIGHSVFASEHNLMMHRGRNGEREVTAEVLRQRTTGIVSMVSDTYNIYEYVDQIVGVEFKEAILERDGVFVVRPDSVTDEHDTPAKISLWILESLWNNFGGTVNKKGYKVLDPHVRCIYGDSLTDETIEELLELIIANGFSAENMVFGCGSWLLDKHNRDTQQFAYKSSAMRVDGKWVGVQKDPIGKTFKTSPKGRMKVVKDGDTYKMLTEFDDGYDDAKDELVTVFVDGVITKRYTLDEIRANASI